MPDNVGQLRALEREVEREWWWLNGALHAVAQAHAEGNLPDAVQRISAQRLAVDRKRVEIAMRLAQLNAQGSPR